MKKILTGITLALVLSSCGQQAQDGAATAPEADVSVYAAAVANASRPESDRARDAGRKPADVLEFFGIEPDMTVLDLFSGGGYYTEIVAHVVGEKGHVVAHANQVLLSFVGDEFKERHADNRLPNTEILMAENNELELVAGQFDAVIMTLNYHDLYWVSPDRGWAKFDVQKFLAELYKGLKPGGIFGVVDHYAEAGSPRETGGTLHRIDPDIVIADVEMAGFVLEDQNDTLRNMSDDHSKSVFDPEVRGKTDRFIFRFRKPE